MGVPASFFRNSCLSDTRSGESEKEVVPHTKTRQDRRQFISALLTFGSGKIALFGHGNARGPALKFMDERTSLSR